MLTKLVAIQRREALTDGQMAARLGCSRPLWNLVRNGKLPLSDTLAIRAAGIWPELTRDLLDMTTPADVPSTNAPSNAGPGRTAA